MLLRGGSSKGAFFLADDLPADEAARDDLLCRIMGSPDERQIDGIGGAHPLTSKVAVVAPAADPGRAEVDYLFLQVGVDQAVVTDRQNCGNLLAAVGPFALERGLLAAESGVDPGPDAATTDRTVRIRMVNSDSVAVARFGVTDGRPVYDGDTEISGVPGTAAAITLDFDDLAGGTAGALLPTGNTVDEVAGTACTLIDNGMPVVVLDAADLGIDGHEPCAELEADPGLRQRLEVIRLEAGRRMGLGDVAAATIPKLTMVAAPRNGGHLATRTFIPHRCHQAIGVLGAVSVATAALLDDTPAASRCAAVDGDVVRLEHPSGTFDAVVGVTVGPDGVRVDRAGIIRTARKLMDGVVFPRPRLDPSTLAGRS